MAIHHRYNPRSKEEVKGWYKIYLANGRSSNRAADIVGGVCACTLLYQFRKFGFEVRKACGEEYIKLDGIRFYPQWLRGKKSAYWKGTRNKGKEGILLGPHLRKNYGWRSVRENTNLIIALLRKKKTIEEAVKIVDDIYDITK